jgi:hypothetical protein
LEGQTALGTEGKELAISRDSGRRVGWAVGAAVLALALVMPASAMAASSKGTSSITLSNDSACVFGADYSWSGFGGAGLSAYAIVALYLRHPGQADQLITFSQQSDSTGQNAKAGELVYSFGDQRSWFISVLSSLDADSRVVAVGELIAVPRHLSSYLVTAARAESIPQTIPAACTT